LYARPLLQFITGQMWLFGLYNVVRLLLLDAFRIETNVIPFDILGDYVDSFVNDMRLNFYCLLII
jgi:hypothetical protein